MQTGWAGWGNHVASFRDVQHPPLIIRPPVKGDPEPVFSDCTLPIIIFVHREDNYNHVLTGVLPQVHHWFHNEAVDDGITYVVRWPSSPPLLPLWSPMF